MFAALRQHLGMPLLTKELAEQATRKRTYLVRFIYTAVLFGVGLFIIYGRGAQGNSDLLGQGQEMFYQVFHLQLAAILLVLPALCAGAFAGEKERESLSLLLLTTIPSPLIVLQKLLSRVIPMLAFVMLSFPLMATAYSFGGVQTTQLVATLTFLVMLTIYVGSVSIMSSTYCRTTVEAYVMTYVCLLASWPLVRTSLPSANSYRFAAMTSGESILASVWQAGAFMAPLTAVALLFANSFLYQRAFVPPKNFLLSVFKKLDEYFNGMNVVTGGVILVKDGDPYPDDDPITWRETAKRSLGTFRYLFRVLTVLELPILFVSQTVRLDSTRTQTTMSVLLYMLWMVALILTSIHSASVISSERSRQSLDVLLVSPMTGREIVSRKLSGVVRLFWMLLVPFSTIFLFQHWFHGFGWDIRYLILQYASLFSVMLLIRWLGMGIGMQSRSQMRASMTLLAILTTVVMSGPIFNYTLDLVGYPLTIAHRSSGTNVTYSMPPLRMLPLLTPGSWLLYLERIYPAAGAYDERWVRFWSLGAVVLLYGAAALGLRAWILASADAFLGRVRPGDPVPPRQDEESQFVPAT